MSTPEMIDGARPAIRISRRYPHPIDRVWRALTERPYVTVWFPSDIDLTPEAGSLVSFGAAGHGRVEIAEAPTRLAFTWGEDLLDFTLASRGAETEVVLTHHFGDRGGAASFATGWEQCLAGLEDALDDRVPAVPDDRGAARHEELIVHFGLDRPVVSHPDDGWHVRFERQLICTDQQAWDLFFGGQAAPGVGAEFRSHADPEVVRGTVGECEPPRVFAFTTAAGEPGDHVRLSLGDGTGHGARLVLEVSGDVDDELDAAVDVWSNGAIGHLVQEAARLAHVG